jgi:methyl-accepting chemotaxis protein
MRAAEAAKNTSELIDTTIQKVYSGTELSNATSKEFNRVNESAAKVGELVGEIAAATKEQAHGIGQISTAIEEMNSVTQKNAAGAEESASASQQMNAQAEVMRNLVTELIAMVGGDKDRQGARETGGIHAPKISQSPRQDIQKKVAGPKSTKGVEVSPEKLIPMDDAEFDDF